MEAFEDDPYTATDILPSFWATNSTAGARVEAASMHSSFGLEVLLYTLGVAK